ncbi:MAG: hypothetical protein WCI74_11845 [Actinomycetes bacterium]
MHRTDGLRLAKTTGTARDGLEQFVGAAQQRVGHRRQGTDTGGIGRNERSLAMRAYHLPAQILYSNL